MPYHQENPPSPEEKQEKRIGRVDAEFRFNPKAQYREQEWPDVVQWRGKTFLRHNILSDGTAAYDAPSGPAEGAIIIDEKGFVIGGHDGEFRKWPVVEEELISEEAEKNL